MLKKIPIGVSDFKEIITEDYYYIDKSLFIKEIIDDGSKSVLIPRPRRFGKTLNLGMLKYFFDMDEKQNLFTKLNIWKHKEYHKERGRYPVIFLTFKDVKHSDYNNCIFKIKEIISTEVSTFEYLLDSDKISENDKITLKRIISRNAETVEYESVLSFLPRCLETHHGEKTVILIDEYDIPIQSGYMSDFYGQIIEFMRNFLSAGLKDNSHLQKAVITGILRVSKESIFSGLNNLLVATILDDEYSDKFGLLENEVTQMVDAYALSTKMPEVKQWYNGYNFGKSTVYNPWSIINYIYKGNPIPQPFWVNTSSNDLIKRLITIGDPSVKSEMELLIQGKSIRKKIDSNIAMNEIETSSDVLWNLFLFSGYLKWIKQEQINRALYCDLAIPNEEVLYLFENIISSWFTETLKPTKYQLLLKSLVTGDYNTFGKVLNDFAVASLSYFDPTGDESEKVYHAFVLGLLINLSGEYDIRSNRESGYGRYDVCMFPKDVSKRGIIFEFKKIDHYENETVEIACEEALKQIIEKDYAREIKELGVKEVVAIGIGFEGKKMKLMYKLI